MPNMCKNYTKWKNGVLAMLCAIHASSYAIHSASETEFSKSIIKIEKVRKDIGEFKYEDNGHVKIDGNKTKSYLLQITAKYINSLVEEDVNNQVSRNEKGLEYVKECIRAYNRVRKEKVSAIIGNEGDKAKHGFYMVLEAVIAPHLNKKGSSPANNNNNQTPTPREITEVDVFLDFLKKERKKSNKDPEKIVDLSSLLEEIKGEINTGNFSESEISSTKRPVLAAFIKKMGYSSLIEKKKNAAAKSKEPEKIAQQNKEKKHPKSKPKKKKVEHVKDSFNTAADKYVEEIGSPNKKGATLPDLLLNKVQLIEPSPSLLEESAAQSVTVQEMTEVLLADIGKEYISSYAFLNKLNKDTEVSIIKVKIEERIGDKLVNLLKESAGLQFALAGTLLLLIGRVSFWLLEGRRGAAVRVTKVGRDRRKRKRKKFLRRYRREAGRGVRDGYGEDMF